MSARYFLDTNIFVYSFDESAIVKAKRAIHLIGEAVTTRKGIVSYQVVQEFFNVALRQFKEPMRADEAEQCLKAAIALAQRQEAKFWELRAATSLAKLWANQGRREEGRDLLAPVHGCFTEGLNTVDLKDAKALLDELA